MQMHFPLTLTAIQLKVSLEKKHPIEMYRSLYIAELAQGPKAMEHIFRWGY
jgi:hypothetical protein